MQEEVFAISQKELTRYDVLRRVLDGTISLKAAADYMGVSYRQAKRLKSKSLGGAPALIHGSRGRPAPNRLDETIRSRILEMSREDYKDFNDTHFTEELFKQGIIVSRETVRTIRREAGIAPKRKRKPKKHHRRRPRKTSEGLMMLWDGSPHRWFGPESDPCHLMVAMDDAKGTILDLLFCETECSWAYLTLLKGVVQRHGIPCSVYQDKHTALKRNDSYWSLEEELAGRREPTQVGLALEDLGIKSIFANSPQAKGRVEKLNETLQDRLVAELMLKGIKDIATANAFVHDGYIERFNKRFGVPASGEHRWRRLGPGFDLDRICSFRYNAKVGNDNAIRFHGLIFDIPPGPGDRSYAGCLVELRQFLDGSWRIYYADKLIAKAESTEVGEPFRAKRRRNYGRAAYECEWVYLASRQQSTKEPVSGKLPRAGYRRDPGKPVAATRIA